MERLKMIVVSCTFLERGRRARFKSNRKQSSLSLCLQDPEIGDQEAKIVLSDLIRCTAQFDIRDQLRNVSCRRRTQDTDRHDKI